MPDFLRSPARRRYDIVIVGGGLGGCAAAHAATQLGCRVLMTEETDWIGGQLTSQAVPPDEHRWIEEYGRTASYSRLRRLIRAYYREHYPLTARRAVESAPQPRRGLGVRALLRAARGSCSVGADACSRADIRPAGNPNPVQGRPCRNREWRRHDPIHRTARIERRFRVGSRRRLLPGRHRAGRSSAAGTEAEYVTGAESREETGEMHAPEGEARPDNVQALTWCLPVAYDPSPGANHVIDRPAMYDFWRGYVPDLAPAPWPGPLLGVNYTDPFTLQPRRLPITPRAEWRAPDAASRPVYLPANRQRHAA